MKAAGFSKKGRTFRLAAENGDHALLDFHTHAVDPDRFVFDVEFSIVPAAQWAFVNRQYPEPLRRAPDSSGAMVICPVMPPPEAAHQPDEEMPFRSRWAFVEPTTRDDCGQELARVLREESIPRMVRLLDRKFLLEEIRINPNKGMVRLRKFVMCEIMLRIDDDPVADVAALVSEAEGNGIFPPFIAWARRRLAERGASAGTE
jgi:hypothetical protein